MGSSSPLRCQTLWADRYWSSFLFNTSSLNAKRYENTKSNVNWYFYWYFIIVDFTILTVTSGRGWICHSSAGKRWQRQSKHKIFIFMGVSSSFRCSRYERTEVDILSFSHKIMATGKVKYCDLCCIFFTYTEFKVMSRRGWICYNSSAGKRWQRQSEHNLHFHGYFSIFTMLKVWADRG